MNLKNLPIKAYTDLRTDLNTGDLYFEIDHSFGGWWIQLQASLKKYNPAFSHVGILRWDNNLLMGLEAVFPRSGQARFSTIVEQHKNSTFILVKINVSNLQREGILNSALNYLGRRYDLKGIGGFVARELEERLDLHTFEKATNFGSGTAQLFCSEYVSLCLLENGLICSKQVPSKLSPSQLFHDGIECGLILPYAILDSRTLK